MQDPVAWKNWAKAKFTGSVGGGLQASGKFLVATRWGGPMKLTGTGAIVTGGAPGLGARQQLPKGPSRRKHYR